MRINKSIFIYLSLLASIPFGHSCLSPNNDKIVYTKIDNEIWPKDSIITINVSNIDKGNYMVLLELIYNRKYPFQNISIGAMIETNEQEYKLSKDIKLRNDYGQTTTGGIYTFFQKSDTIIDSISLTDSINNFNIHLIQKFDNELVGIDKIGVYLKYLD